MVTKVARNSAVVTKLVTKSVGEQKANMIRCRPWTKDESASSASWPESWFARHLKTTEDLFDSRPSPRTESLVGSAVQWAEKIMRKVDAQR